MEPEEQAERQRAKVGGQGRLPFHFSVFARCLLTRLFGAEQRPWTEGWPSTTVPKKLWGCIAAPPSVPFRFAKEAYLFFLAFFFAAILLSSELFKISDQHCWRSAYSIIMFRVIELSCQEESDCRRRKSEARRKYFDHHAGSRRVLGPKLDHESALENDDLSSGKRCFPLWWITFEVNWDERARLAGSPHSN